MLFRCGDIQVSNGSTIFTAAPKGNRMKIWRWDDVERRQISGSLRIVVFIGNIGEEIGFRLVVVYEEVLQSQGKGASLRK